MQTKTRSAAAHLCYLCCLVYFASYLTRLDFAAVLVEFIQAEGVARTQAAVITTASLATYGCGQLISGWLGDHIPPRLMIAAGLLFSACANVLLPMVSPRYAWMAVIWGINGFAQACIWPPMVALLKACVPKEMYGRYIQRVSLSAGAATVLLYLVIPLLLQLGTWRLAMEIPALIAACTAVIWFRGTSSVDVRAADGTVAAADTETDPRDRLLWRILPLILLSIALQGMLREGFGTWMPSLLFETYQLRSDQSILVSVFLPLFHMAAAMTAYRVLKSMRLRLFPVIALFFALTVLILGVTIPLIGTRLLLATLLIAVVYGCIHAINLLQTGYIPALMRGSRHISLLSGILNSASYAGGVASAWVFALLSDQSGWTATLQASLICACAGLAVVLVCCVLLRRRNAI